jgi:hypothetical protein
MDCVKILKETSIFWQLSERKVAFLATFQLLSA